MADLVKPTVLAKELEIRPQRIYGLIKQGKIAAYDGEKSQMVDRTEVENYLSQPPMPGRKKGSKNKTSRRGIGNTKVNQVLGYNWAPRGGRRFMKIESIDALEEEGRLAAVKMLDSGEVTTFMADALDVGQVRGRYKQESLQSLLRYCVEELRAKEQVEQADKVEEVIESLNE